MTPCSCVCGKVKLEVNLPTHHVSICHCATCRQQTSGINMTIAVENGHLEFSDRQFLGIYDSSAWGERGFCINCGTNLFWRMKDHSICNINAFCIEEQLSDAVLTTEIYIDKKPDFYEFKNKTEQYTEADVIAFMSK